MSVENYQGDCEGCLPAMLDMQTRQPLPKDHPAMVAVMEVWDETTWQEREVYHRCCCQNSRDPEDLRIFQEIAMRMQKKIKEVK